MEKRKIKYITDIVRVRKTKKLNEIFLQKIIYRNRFFYLLTKQISSLFSYKTLPVILSLALIFCAFSLGAYFTWQTDKSFAEENVSKISTENRLVNENLELKSHGIIEGMPNKILFSLTLEQLEKKFMESIKPALYKEAEKLADRKFKLKIYLDNKKSPLIDIVDTLAELKHWKLVLAISNSESTLGKRCYNNNCSGIGVEPGHPLWREYKTKADWAKDLDRLLEKRYKDWTLEEMNGVYNQPGSKNWLLASRQILEELEEARIE